MSENQDTREIFLEQIDLPPENMRTEINRDTIFELADDIKKNGLINAVLVRPRGERFEIVAGQRRLLAHRYGGIAKVRCLVRELSDDEAFAIMTSENLAREDVNPVDEATHVARLMKIHNEDISKVADIVNRGDEWVKQRVLIASMPENLKEALRLGKIKIGVALALTEITTEIDRDACLEMAISQGASITVVRYWVAQWHAGLFGSALMQRIADPTALNGERTIIMLRCSVDGLEYPATDFTSVIVRRENVGYIDAIRQHLESERLKTNSSADVEPIPAGG